MHPRSATVRHGIAAKLALCLLLAVSCAMLVAPLSASARLFTVCNLISCPPSGSSISITDATSGVIGSIDPVLSAIGTVGNFDGAAPNFTNDFLIFDVTLAAGSTPIDQITVSLTANGGPPLGEPTTTGYFSDAGQAPNGTTAPHTQEITNDPLIQIIPFPIGTGQGIFDFDWGGSSAGNLQAGETTVRLFVIFSTSMDLLENTAVGFMISPVGAADYTVQGQIIPEPGTILLLGSGLVALGMGQRRRRRQRP